MHALPAHVQQLLLKHDTSACSRTHYMYVFMRASNKYVVIMHARILRCIPSKRPLPGKRQYTTLQGIKVAASIQIYAIYISGKCPCRLKLRVMFIRPWELTRDTMVCAYTCTTHYTRGCTCTHM
jgi:hypothetical protein